MSNHITTEITAAKHVAQALLSEELDDGEFPVVDFKRIIPEPDNLETGGCNGSHDPGIVCWYEWKVENWGTKWNAYDARILADVDGMTKLRFDTAWSHPRPIIDKLSAMFPDETIRVRYADEDLGSNLGTYTIRGGAMSDPNFPEYGPEAKDLAAQIKYGQTYAECQKEWGGEGDDE